ncbi:AAA family ATPase [uncultured Marinococcus sp.]|uniref:AAA family ATPase n=1 Tax=uncultured Marinococcus sp. TaxID=487012 RepID=UPI002623CAA5|nr:AAA family ATPase [uncultured Marinococcus sp.]
MTKVIVIRGNSGSGKTTVAQRIQTILGPGSLLVSQDIVRREMLGVKDRPNNLSIGLIQAMIEYGMSHCPYVIIEGILAEDKYGMMLRETLAASEKVIAYYYDLPFEETVARHQTKTQPDFGEASMKSWFIEQDFLGLENEQRVTKDITEEEIVINILADVKGTN